MKQRLLRLLIVLTAPVWLLLLVALLCLLIVVILAGVFLLDPFIWAWSGHTFFIDLFDEHVH